jgi:rod shape-determining protein MreC
MNSDAAKQLISENESLKAEVAKLHTAQSDLPGQSAGYLNALVYSRYPLNFKNELLVNAGLKDGVAVGAAATFQGILIGEVEKVFEDTSVVETVFDSRFKLPVRVGNGGAQSLLAGGSAPAATLIPRAADISAGDVVYSASADFPYGLPIGEIADIKISSDQLFKEASLKFSYDINSVGAVLIKK